MRWKFEEKIIELRKSDTYVGLPVYDNIFLLDEGLHDDLHEARLLFTPPLWHLVMHQVILVIYKVLQ